MTERVVPARRAGVAARRRRLATWIAAAAIVVALVGGLTFTPLVGAREVLVEGNRALSDDAVAAIARVGEGTNVVHLDTAAVERRLEDDPWVERATVSTELPGTIVVRVVERIPVLVSDGRVLAADATVLPGAEGDGLPTLEIDLVVADPTDVAAAAAAAGALIAEVRAQVATILVEPDGDLVLDLDGGIAVSYGPPGQDAAKAEALRALLRWADEEGVEIVAADVSVPAAPTARPAGGAPIAVP